ncbi:MAG: hypothetical protein KatS3mg011_0080 [Acidimicrobiia bacterium]|nr:MAG: hypothetical protein KatS3mg011_0080 [Acidimicrobiia bacterium]
MLPLLLAVLIGFVELAALFGARLELVAAAREGARVAATVPDPARAVEAARRALPDSLRSRVTIRVRRPSVVGAAAEVVVSYRRNLVTPLVRGITVPLTARAVMRVER